MQGEINQGNGGECQHMIYILAEISRLRLLALDSEAKEGNIKHFGKWQLHSELKGGMLIFPQNIYLGRDRRISLVTNRCNLAGSCQENVKRLQNKCSRHKKITPCNRYMGAQAIQRDDASQKNTS